MKAGARYRIKLAAAALLSAGALAFLAETVRRTYFEVRPAGPPPSAVPDAPPRMAGGSVPADAADHMQDDELVIGAVVDGRPRAYPVGYLAAGEHLNDRIGGHPVCATW